MTFTDESITLKLFSSNLHRGIRYTCFMGSWFYIYVSLINVVSCTILCTNLLKKPSGFVTRTAKKKKKKKQKRRIFFFFDFVLLISFYFLSCHLFYFILFYSLLMMVLPNAPKQRALVRKYLRGVINRFDALKGSTAMLS